MLQKIEANTKVYFRTVLGETVYGLYFTLGENHAKIEHIWFMDRLNIIGSYKYKICKLTDINSTVLAVQREIREVLGIGFIPLQVTEVSLFKVELDSELPFIVF